MLGTCQDQVSQTACPVAYPCQSAAYPLASGMSPHALYGRRAAVKLALLQRAAMKLARRALPEHPPTGRDEVDFEAE